jgi:hypothetical protein
MEPKKKGFWSALRRFFDPTGKEPPFFRAFGSALRWGEVIVGSLSREIPGGEVIHEFVESVQAGYEQYAELTETGEQRHSPLRARSPVIRNPRRRPK